MKTISIKAKRIIVFCGLLMSVFACDDGFDEINTNPNSISDLDPGAQFSWVVRRMTSERYETWRGNLIYSSEWAQQLAGTWGPDTYDVTNEDWAHAQWVTTYRDYLRNINDVIARTEEGSNQNLIARTLRVFFMQRLTDLYGDLPYSEAGGASTNPSPVYDTQQDIYQSFVADLTAASSGIDASAAADSFNEPIYGGDLDSWRRFANSILLKVGMRMSEVDPSAAQSAVSQALSGGVFTSNDHIAYVDFSSGNLRNGIGSVFQDFGTTGHQFSYSDEFVTRLQGQNDPRIPVLMAQYDADGNVIATADADFVGRTNGDRNEFDVSNAQPHRENMVAYTSPRVLMSFAEVEFLRAEAILRGWASGTAADAYNSGITAACGHLDLFTGTTGTISSGDIADLLAEPSVAYNASTGLEQIITQKWIALIFNGYEAYAEYRRTGFPNLTVAAEPEPGITAIPGKLRYPVSESISNGENYAAAIARIGGDNITASVWWDVN